MARPYSEMRKKLHVENEFKHAQFLYNADLYVEALRALDIIILQMPDFVEAYKMRVNIFCATGDYNKALIDLNKILELKPTLLEIHLKHAMVLYSLGSYSLALEGIDYVIDKDPNCAKAYHTRAKILVAMGDFENALLYFDFALKNNPNLTDVHNERALLLNTLNGFETVNSSNVAFHFMFNNMTENVTNSLVQTSEAQNLEERPVKKLKMTSIEESDTSQVYIEQIGTTEKPEFVDLETVRITIPASA